MKKYIMIPALMMSFLFTNNIAQASNGADKYLHRNYATSSKPKKNKIGKKQSKPTAKAKYKSSPKVTKVGKKYGRSVAHTGSKAKSKKRNKKNY